MPKKKYIVSLTSEERAYLDKLTTTGKTSAYKINHARVLLLADTNREEGGWIDQANDFRRASFASTLNISASTIERVRQRFVEEGLEQALNRQPQSQYKPRRLDGEQEARLIAITCSTPPSGCSHWTLRLLAEQLVELEGVETISYETVRQTLKKTNLSLG
jgi:transposase